MKKRGGRKAQGAGWFARLFHKRPSRPTEGWPSPSECCDTEVHRELLPSHLYRIIHERLYKWGPGSFKFEAEAERLSSRAAVEIRFWARISATGDAKIR